MRRAAFVLSESGWALILGDGATGFLSTQGSPETGE